MNVVFAGGAGRVGAAILPFLKDRLQIRVLDLVPPPLAEVEYMHGNVTDPADVARALRGMNAVVYMVMPPLTHYHDIAMNHDLNVKGLHLTLQAAVDAGIKRAVFASSGSVHSWTRGRLDCEELPCDADDVYGFTKGLGETVCRWFSRTRSMTIVSLRLFRPLARDEWLQARTNPKTRYDMWATSAIDAARAFEAALTRPLSDFHAIFVAGDYRGERVNLSRAKELLGWEPFDRRLGDA